MSLNENKSAFVKGPVATFIPCWCCGQLVVPDKNGHYRCDKHESGPVEGSINEPRRAAIWDKVDRIERDPIAFQADYITVPYIDHSAEHYSEPSCTGPLPYPLEEYK